jgi:uncharacterized repeat protein (TIGR01451 family)
MTKLHSVVNVVLALAVVCALGLLVGPGAAVAQEPPGQELPALEPPPVGQEPPNCTYNNFDLNIGKDVVGYVHQGQCFNYTVAASNDNTPPIGCNVEDCNITFQQPSFNGTDTGAWDYLDTFADFPSDGSGDRTYEAVNHTILHYCVNVSANVTKITARADGAGILMTGFNDSAVVSKNISVGVLWPAIAVNKTGDTLSKVGDNVTYNITVRNTGDCNLTKTSVIDDRLGNLTANFSATLAVNASESHEFIYTVPNVTGPLWNNVTAIYQDVTGYAVNDTDSHNVTLVHPGLNITKTGTNTSKVGDNVTYNITVRNTGDVALNRTSVIDDRLGNKTANFSAVLAANTSESRIFIYTVPPAAPDPMWNNVTATYTVSGFPNVVNATASHSVDLVHPGLNITKTGDTLSKVGDNVTYNITVRNTGDVALNKTSVIDDRLGNKSADFAAVLAVNASESHNYIYTVPPAAPDPMWNNVTATYTVSGFPNVVNATASHSVDLVHPGLNVTKTGDTLSKVGDNVTYNITVRNTGDVALNRTSVIDDRLGDKSADFAAVLAANTSESHNYIYTVPPAAPDPMWNNVTATYTVSGFPNVLNATASHSVDLVHPGLNVTKTGDTLSKVGDSVTYNITVRNTGDVALNRTSVIDDRLGTLTGSFAPVLAANTSEGHNFTYTTPANATDPMWNNVTAIYTASGLGNVVNATASHSVDLVHPSISCSKTANPTHGPVGTNITYNITVTNTGDVALNKTSVIDTLLGNKTADFAAVLAVNASESHLYYRNLVDSDPPYVNNTVVFHYQVPVLLNDVNCTASASVEVERIEGCLEICKFQDANANGIWEPGEPWLAGWEFHVKGPAGYDKWWTTGGDGCIFLDNLVPGTYTVTETLKAGWYNTKPGGSAPYKQTVVVPPGEDCPKLEFGNRELLALIPPMVPTVDPWGIGVMIALFAGLLVWTVRRRRLAS